MKGRPGAASPATVRDRPLTGVREAAGGGRFRPLAAVDISRKRTFDAALATVGLMWATT